MLSFSTNFAALTVQRSLSSIEATSSAEIRRLSSGRRIVSAADDASGLAIATGIRTRQRSLQIAERNAMTAISMAQVADSASGQMSEILLRMRELAMQAADDGNAANRLVLDEEYIACYEALDRIAWGTTYNGQSLLAGDVWNPEATPVTSISPSAFPWEQSVMGTLDPSTPDLVGPLTKTNYSVTMSVGGTSYYFGKIAGSWQALAPDGFTARPITLNELSFVENATRTDPSFNADVGKFLMTSGGSNTLRAAEISVLRPYDPLAIYGKKPVRQLSASPFDPSDPTSYVHAIPTTYTTTTGATGSATTYFRYVGDNAWDAYVTNGTNTAYVPRFVPFTTPWQSITLGGNTFQVVPNVYLSSTPGEVEFQVGTSADASSRASVSFGGLAAQNLGLSGRYVTSTGTLRTYLMSRDESLDTMRTLDAALETLSARRAGWGAALNRFDGIVSQIQFERTASAAAASRIEDVDVAAATADLARSTILREMSAPLLAEASRSARLALQLIAA